MFQFVKLFCIDISSVETKKKKKERLFFSPLIVIFWFRIFCQLSCAKLYLKLISSFAFYVICIHVLLRTCKT